MITRYSDRHCIARRLALAATICGAMSSAPALATEGYFQNGISVRSKGLAGAGSADPLSPLVLAQNPAGIVEIDTQLELGLSIFSPLRQFEGSGGPGFTPSGVVKSGRNFFFLPTVGYTRRLSENSAIGVALYGNGGLNTAYGSPANPACASPPLPAPNGVFCGGKTGVDLIQVFLSVGYSHKFGDAVSVGVAPVLAMQMLKADGLQAFAFNQAGQPLTIDPSNLSDNGYSTSTGYGARVGILVKPIPQIRLAASYQTEMTMSRFKKYRGLFEGAGKFNIPSNYTLGIAVDPSPELTLMFDYRHINYEDVPAVSNSSSIPQQFGSAGGPGFGWKNVDSYKFGAEWNAGEALTLRGGVSFNNNPVPSEDVTLNILAPGVSKQHYTAGARLKTSERSAFDFSLLYSPNARTRGIEVTPAGPNPGHRIKLQMHQFEAGLAWTLRFGR